VCVPHRILAFSASHTAICVKVRRSFSFMDASETSLELTSPEMPHTLYPPHPATALQHPSTCQ
jgi:hypothetical protein